MTRLLLTRFSWPAAALAALFIGGTSPDMAREALPPTAPPFSPPHTGVLLAENFHSGRLDLWDTDRADVWSIRRGMLRADLPDVRQQRSFIYAGSEAWTDYVVDLDVCAMRGVDKGVVVRVRGGQGVGVDLRSQNYQDVLLYRREWQLGKARVVNANGVWHHIKVEARGPRYNVWVDGDLLIDRTDGRGSQMSGRIALPAYTGGVGQCTVYYDNIIVTEIPSPVPAGGTAGP